jgi:SAM-dependent methyltransferase
MDYKKTLNRYQLSEIYCKKWDGKFHNQKVLDAGAGERRASAFFKNNSYTSQDFGQYTDESWDAISNDIISDICCIPVENDTYDLIICFEVLEHLPDPKKAIKELTRILKPGGALLLTVPNLCSAHQEPYFFHSGFSEQFFSDAIITCENNLSLEDLYIENDFTAAHTNELKTLISSQNKFYLKILLYLLINIFRESLKLLKQLPHFRQPKSCSGFFVVYRKN